MDIGDKDQLVLAVEEGARHPQSVAGDAGLAMGGDDTGNGAVAFGIADQCGTEHQGRLPLIILG